MTRDIRDDKCPNGAPYDLETMLCRCGAGHPNPDFEAHTEDARDHYTVKCGICGQSFSTGDHSCCWRRALDGTKPT